MFFKTSFNNKNSNSLSNKKSSLFYFLPKKWWSCDYFFFPASEAPKNFWGPQKRFKFWILDLKACLKKLGIGAGCIYCSLSKSSLSLSSTVQPNLSFKLELFASLIKNQLRLIVCTCCSGLWDLICTRQPWLLSMGL